MPKKKIRREKGPMTERPGSDSFFKRKQKRRDAFINAGGSYDQWLDGRRSGRIRV